MGKPIIRFQGYTDDWEQRKLDAVAKFSKGNGYSKGDLIESGTPIILYGRLYTKYETSISNVDTYVEAKEGSVYSKGGEVIIPASGETAEDIARAATVDKAGVLLGGDLNVVMPNEDINSAFLAISISNGNAQLELAKKAQGKSVVHIHNEEIRNLIVPFPTKSEQNKIVGYFSNLDHLITLHQRKCDETKKLKKYMLQKMFPQNGQNVPEIRFGGFTDAWEQRKLGEVCSRVQGNDGRMDLPTLTISAANGWMRQEERFSGNIAGKEQKNYTLLHKGELSYNHGNSKLAKYGTVFSLQTYEEALVPRVYHSFKVEAGNSDFIEYYFATNLPDRELGKLISSGARMDGLLNIGYDEFMGIQMMLPTMEEQNRISDYFRRFDHLITLHQHKLFPILKSTFLTPSQIFLKSVFSTLYQPSAPPVPNPSHEVHDMLFLKNLPGSSSQPLNSVYHKTIDNMHKTPQSNLA